MMAEHLPSPLNNTTSSSSTAFRSTILSQPNMEALEHVAQVMAPDLLAFESAEAVPRS